MSLHNTQGPSHNYPQLRLCHSTTHRDHLTTTLNLHDVIPQHRDHITTTLNLQDVIPQHRDHITSTLKLYYMSLNNWQGPSHNYPQLKWCHSRIHRDHLTNQTLYYVDTEHLRMHAEQHFTCLRVLWKYWTHCFLQIHKQYYVHKAYFRTQQESNV